MNTIKPDTITENKKEPFIYRSKWVPRILISMMAIPIVLYMVQTYRNHIYNDGYADGYSTGRFDECTAHYVMHKVPEAGGLDVILQRGEKGTRIYVFNSDHERCDSPFWEDRYDHIIGVDKNDDGRVESTSCSIEPAEFLRRYENPEERKTLNALAGFNNTNNMTQLEQFALERARREN
jgi:hypothetical protein